MKALVCNLLLIAVGLVLSACTTAPPPSPVSVTPVSLAGIDSKLVRSGQAADRMRDSIVIQAGSIDRQLSALERQRLALRRAKQILDGKTIVP